MSDDDTNPDCPQIRRIAGGTATREQCKTEAAEEGANAMAFNLHFNNCYLKLCTGGDLKLEYKEYMRTFTDIYSC